MFIGGVDARIDIGFPRLSDWNADTRSTFRVAVLVLLISSVPAQNVGVLIQYSVVEGTEDVSEFDLELLTSEANHLMGNRTNNNRSIQVKFFGYDQFRRCHLATRKARYRPGEHRMRNEAHLVARLLC